MSEPRAAFAAYLEISGPGPEARRWRERLGEEFVEALRLAWSGAVHGVDVTRQVVVHALGEADRESATSLTYALPTRPGYLYEFRFASATGILREAGFARAGDAPLLPARPATRFEADAVVAALARVGATSAEVRAVLGEPEEVTGWWPNETWRYSNGTTVELRHLVVE